MKTRLVFVGLVLALLQMPVTAEPTQISELEFQNQRLSDILAVLANVANVSVLPDATVTGTASYFFSETTFDEAFRNFLDAFDLFTEFRDGVYHVSRILADYDSGTGTITVEAREVELRLLLEAVSKAIGKTILYDPLPSDTLSINAQSVSVPVALEILTRRLSGFEIQDEGDYFYVRRIPHNATAQAETAPGPMVVREGDLYGISIGSTRANVLLDELFGEAGVEFVSFAQSDSIVRNLVTSLRPFGETLRLVLDQAGLDVVVDEGVYVLLDLQRRDILKRFQQVHIVQLRHLAATEFPNLLPSDLAGADLYRIDQAGNRVIFTGTPREVEPLLEFLESIDKPNEALAYRRFDLQYATVEDIIQVLPSRFASEDPRIIPNTNSFVVALTEEIAADLAAYLAVVDRPNESLPIHLRYIRAEDLLENLPPSIRQENLVSSVDPSLVFFVGTEQQQERFLRELELIDRPVPQIQYQLLVIQFQRSQNLNYSFSLENSVTEDGLALDGIFLGALGQLLSLNFDIVSTFGYQFAVQLNAELGNNDARVMADTTLNALSGQEVRFQNTNTFRYRDVEIDPDTGEPRTTGVTREITSGLIIAINGWTSGDGMITMDISATVSNRGSDASTLSGNPPPTSERIVNTHVRTESGEPIVIGGLIQQNSDEANKKTPLLSRIPLIGKLFQRTAKSVENTELVIYVVPHVTRGTSAAAEDHYRVRDLYERLVRGQVGM